MQINDLLRKDLMILDLQATEKEAAIDEMIGRLSEKNVISDKETYKEGIMQREAQTSTGLGDGVAMPHSKNKAVKEPAVLFAKSSKGVDYESLDGQPTHYLFMIAAPEGGNDLHLQVLASLSRKLVNPEVLEQLDQASTPEDVQAIFAESEEDTKEVAPSTDGESADKKFVVAVTACPTGIAHTYMAEDALKRKADEMGVTIRVETNGSDGAKNQLTADEIRRADGVIIAADKKVELARFNGKHVLQRPVSEGINKSEELITKAMNQQAPVLRIDGDSTESNDSEDEGGSVWNTLYKDLMNGISHMLPFVVGGGIILAISFIVEQFLGSEHVLFTSLNSIGGAAFQFLIPVLAGYIAYSIADRPGLLPGMAAGFMASQSGAGFLGGLIGGFVAGYLMNFVKKMLAGVPKAFAGLKTILLFPVLGLLLTGIVMVLIIPIFTTINEAMIGFLNNLGTGNAVLLGAVLGGMMAIDMGGPFNKAAYAFSIGIYTDTGDGSLMAAVMMGGMIPPLAIGLATFIFRDKFTDLEKQSGGSNIVLGLSFITEGAIPFAAADPIRVIGSSIIGSAVGGGLTQLWGTSIPAPHGGAIVALLLGENRFLFFLALIIGTAVSTLILGIWKPKVEGTKKEAVAKNLV
ncbi:PTS fructose transporter subunit IIABC [Marinilactibacillus psychrotolerans]|uniref:Fructose-specific PTS system IIC component n=1 Tax=Marinilactibacillus psychrotolerans TaxID=191770 RepID=A0AAV3WX70_9LACT|nr:fructose-specific PTS transporter subunit EIIC [Marinilactibacillus psychrotolerans]GEL66400.1 PTS fructose transporter subunit IIC [Marinilactibacillus psychrotolerans]GEQ36722.1 fructose-specific PTS system IIC component [Marinilactibacillus psychrotolerans]SDD16481.1 PTS system D-fructose-specific IIA component (F1P-forming), Frc family (TC 4.A.2.1.4)/PTS system D-fructose-specific IIB component (F1P-forming), Frc family (TC 4.A.2.1.4)/PTS system D-fructose-specific IIC component (F1P-form